MSMVRAGDLVETIGLTEEEGADAGEVLTVADDWDATVRWDSGTTCVVAAGDLRVIPRGYQSRFGRDRGLPTYESKEYDEEG